MAKYRVNWSEIGDGEDAAVLISAVARYYSSTEYPSPDVTAAILGIEKVKEETDERITDQG